MSKYNFHEYQASNWIDLRNELSFLKDWIFRGQSNYSWSLSTSLERSAFTHQYDTRATVEIEKVILNKFQKRASNYLANIPAKNSFLEWFSLIQHYGGPTRLLDFTHSSYVAAFFAVESTFTDSSIYCLNRPLIYKVGKETEKERNPIENIEFGTAQYADQAILEGRRSPLVMICEPEILNERISAQQGLFGIPFEGNQTFEYNLGNTMNRFKKELPTSRLLTSIEKKIDVLNQYCLLIKIKVPKELHVIIRKDLGLMNINAATLFPGLDGFARSLHSEFDFQQTNELIEFTNYISTKLKLDLLP